MKNVLVAIDFSDVTPQVVSAAEKLARALGAKVWLLHCASESQTIGVVGEAPMLLPVPSVSGAPLNERFPEEHRKLLELTTSLQRAGIDAEPIFVSGSAIDNIIAAMEERQIELVIVGSHGHGALYELMVGTVSKSVLQRARLPTLIIPSSADQTQPQRIGSSRQRELQEVTTG